MWHSPRMRRWLGMVALVWLPAVAAHAQTLFPGLTDAALRDSLVAHYKPAVTLPYDQARDTLFAVIENAGDDSLRGVYTGYALYLDPAKDPTKEACNGDGDDNPSSCSGSLNINTEHAWPQSYGAASGAPRQDMHHLFPARADVNSTRNNHPFADIDETATDKWFRLGATLTTLPGTLLSEYSEFDAEAAVFEPRDARKGDIARAMFYFYTMYRAEADAAVATNTGLSGADFFELQKNTLLAWHNADPPDAAEQARSQAIAAYQDGKENPYVLDPTLVERAFFATPLPVELTSFEAVADGPTVRLRWTTASETNNAGFFVEHRAEPAEATWERLAFVGGRGSATTPGTYAYSAENLAPGAHLFRLRQVDFDGAFAYGPTVRVAVDLPGAYHLSTPHPNPFNPETRFTLAVSRSQRVNVAVYDVLGRRIATLFDGVLVPGAPQPFRFDAARLPGGLYLIHASGEHFTATRPVTLLK
ncbi:endonuclease I family protein [Rhodocaloribacter sp.]